MKKKSVPLFFKNLQWLVKKFIAMVEDTALCHVLVSSVFQLNGSPPHFFHCLHAFMYREFPDHRRGREGPLFWLTNSLDLTPIDSFFFEVSEGHLLRNGE
jgi:hypothetical protein